MLDRALKKGYSDAILRRKSTAAGQAVQGDRSGFGAASHHQIYLQIKFGTLMKEPGGKYRFDTTQYRRILLREKGASWTSK